VKNLIYLVISYLLFSCVITASGQQQGDGEQKFSISHYTEDNGLPQNTVKNISSDSEGFLWIVTETGLVRFDGHNFFVFNKSNLPVSNNRFSMLQPDISGTGGRRKIYAIAENYEFVKIESGKAEPDSVYFKKNISKIPFMRDTDASKILSNGAPNYLKDLGDPENFIIATSSGQGNFYICHSQSVEYYNNWKKKLRITFSKF